MQEHEEVYSAEIEDARITIRKVVQHFELAEHDGRPLPARSSWEVTFEQLEPTPVPSYEGAPPMRFKARQARQKPTTFDCSDQQMATFIRMAQAMSASGV